MRKQTGIYFIMLIILIGHGCATMGKVPLIGKYMNKQDVVEEKKTEKAEAPKIRQAPPKTLKSKSPSDNQRLKSQKKIIDKYLSQQLSKGDESIINCNYKQAEQDYLTTYFIDPTNKLALEKLRELPIEKFSGKYVTYNVKAGDTLANIAKSFYGDYQEYPILAEVNCIQPPYTLKGGQSIKIPKLDNEINLEQAIKQGEECYLTQDFDCAIKEFTTCLLLDPSSEKSKDYLKKSYYEKISFNFNYKNFKDTMNLIQKLEAEATKHEIDLSDISTYLSQIKNSIEHLTTEEEKKLTADKLFEEGKKLQSKGQLSAAKEKYAQSVSILNALEQIDTGNTQKEITLLIQNIDNAQSSEKAARIKEEALKDFEQEEYETALEKIHQVTELDHEDKNAVEWQDNLRNIVELINKAKATVKDNPEQAFTYYKQANAYVIKESDKKSLRLEKEMIKIIPLLKQVAENKLYAEEPCESLRVLNIVIGVDKEINIPYFIKDELREVYSKSSSLKDALKIKCDDL